MNLDGYYLDLHKLDQMKDVSFRDKIYEMYRDMVYSNEDGRTKISQSLFNTLLSNGYLKSVRDDKIESILDGDNSINS